MFVIRSILPMLSIAMVVSTAVASERSAKDRADAMTWPLATTASPEPDVRLDTRLPASPPRSEHADAITWECPQSAALTN